MKSHDNTKKTLRRWKAALIGSLMICVTMVSGCASNYQLPH
ncbi:Rz1-like spanin outer membrane subunit, partial [Salmonella enterica]